MSAISPSRFVANCTSTPLSGVAIAEHDGHCALCGGPITAGEPMTPTSTLGESFNNKHDARGAGSRMICGACSSLSDRVWMERQSKALVTPAGIFKLASNGHQADFILRPPAPPFVAFISAGKMQHLIWRSRVTLSHEEIYVRLGDLQLVFSHRRVMTLFEAASSLRAFMVANGMAGKNPLVGFDRELASTVGARVRPDLARAVEDDAVAAAHVQALESMRIGELWAVGILLIAKPEAVEPPPEIV